MQEVKGATHCENCGCTWLDDGLNPVGCPYCKQEISVATVHEMWAHVPFALQGTERWIWMANYLNHARTHPGEICPCCSASSDGVIHDIPPSGL